MAINLDKVDRKVLLELSKNARTSSENIAKRISISRQMADYRIKSLKKKQIILRSRISINHSLLGYSTCILCLRMRNFDSQKEKEFIDFLIKNTNVAWASSVCGRWDFLIYVYFKDINDLDRIVNEICDFQKNNIDDKEVMPIIKRQVHNILIGDLKKDLKTVSSKYERDFFSFDKTIIKSKKEAKLKLDKTDLKLLDILNQDSTLPLSLISRQLKLNKDTVSYRIKRLIYNKVIHNFILSINYSLLGYEGNYIFFELENFDETSEKKSVDLIKNIDSVLFVAKTFGRKNLVVELYCKSVKEFKDSLDKIKESISPNLKSYDSVQILEELKPYSIKLE
jgi:DNA-binding Lrp family transcriptional regulator